jgi:hypothetical protein
VLDTVSVEASLAVHVDNAVGGNGGDDRLPRGRGKSAIEREDGVAAIPGAPQRVDERRATGQVDGNEMRHGSRLRWRR